MARNIVTIQKIIQPSLIKDARDCLKETGKIAELRDQIQKGIGEPWLLYYCEYYDPWSAGGQLMFFDLPSNACEVAGVIKNDAGEIEIESDGIDMILVNDYEMMSQHLTKWLRSRKRYGEEIRWYYWKLMEAIKTYSKHNEYSLTIIFREAFGGCMLDSEIDTYVEHVKLNHPDGYLENPYKDYHAPYPRNNEMKRGKVFSGISKLGQK